MFVFIVISEVNWSCEKSVLLWKCTEAKVLSRNTHIKYKFLYTYCRKTNQEMTFSVLMPSLNMAINGIIRLCVFGGGVDGSKAVEKLGELGGNAEGDKLPQDMRMG